MQETLDEYVFEFSGGNLALDFANTVSARPGDPRSPRREHLRTYEDLLAWSRQVGLIDPTQADRLGAWARRSPARATAALDRAIAAREAIYGVFSTVAARCEPNPADLDLLNAELGRALHRARVVRTGTDYTWGWADRTDDLDRPLWPVVRAAADLLTAADRDRVRERAAAWCGWLFLDRSHAGRRQWCDMKTCGNRAKARRHYARAKGEVS
ncbi:MAG TPA: ABATE domain-containing protein [Dehalococcoidia bacterium]|nr:ABATE domain-containing protein [Dehalococcoidia bacterium]